MAASFSFDDDLVDGRGAYEPLVLRDGDYVHELLRPEAVESHPMRSTRRGYNRSNPFVGEEREASLWGSQWILRHRKFLKYVVLLTDAWFLFSAMMSDEMVGASVPILKSAHNFTSTDIGIIYSASFIPSLTVVILGGVFMHRIGLRTIAIFSAIAQLIGCLVFIMFDSFYGKVVGRIIFGMGLGPQELVNDVAAIRWFESGGESPSMELAFGIIASAGMFGYTIGFNVLPLLIDKFQSLLGEETVALKTALLVVSIVPVFAFAGNIIFSLIDWYTAPLLELENEVDEEISAWAAVKMLPASYWTLFTILGTTLTMVYIMSLYSVDYLGEKWGLDLTTSGRYSSIVYVAGLIISPLVGFVIGRFGHIVTLLFLGSTSFAAGCMLMGLTTLHPALGLAAIGLGLGVIETSVWTGVAVVIPEISSGPAFSFLSAAISIVLVVAPYGAGFIHDYYHLALMCAASAGIAWIASILLYFQAPELQNSTLKTYMTYVVAIHTTKKNEEYLRHRQRSHSFSGTTPSRVLELVDEYYHDEIFDPKPFDDPTSSDAGPMFVDDEGYPLIFKPSSPALLDDEEDTPKRHQRSRSVPHSLWSKNVSHEVSIVAMLEDPAEHSSMLPNASEVIDMTLKRSNQGDDPQLHTLWAQGESKAPDVLLSEIALASSNHSGSDAGAGSVGDERSAYSPIVSAIDEADEHVDHPRLRTLRENVLLKRAQSEGASWDPFR